MPRQGTLKTTKEERDSAVAGLRATGLIDADAVYDMAADVDTALARATDVERGLTEVVHSEPARMGHILDVVESPGAHPLGAPNSIMRRAQEIGKRFAAFRERVKSMAEVPCTAERSDLHTDPRALACSPADRCSYCRCRALLAAPDTAVRESDAMGEYIEALEGIATCNANEWPLPENWRERLDEARRKAGR